MDKESDAPDDTVLLHGDLDLRIIEARRLPNMDMVTEHLRRCFVPCRTAIDAAKNSRRRKQQPRHHRHKIVTSDPYVKVCLSGATVARTRICPNSQEPVWDESFSIALAHPARWIEFHVKDNDVFGAQLIGVAKLQAADIRRGERIEGWFPVIGSSGAPPKPETAIYVSLQFKPFEENPLYKQGIARDPAGMGVRGTYFPRRKGGLLRLYQDAHVPDGMLPEIALERGKMFQHEKCWEDICHAILEAHHLIYIVGWSVYHKVKLVREPTKPLPQHLMDMTLGDLLKHKSQEGVRVCLLVWDDKTSHSKFMISTEGVMHTHDEETRKFFKHSSVICVLSPRYGSSKHSIVKQKVVGTLFTHHQKCVLVDTQAHGNNRKITAFVGGLDLCDGRYDTPEHRLYHGLDAVFQNDYHNPTFPTEGKGPRQPWHDLHCRIEGPAAYDVLKNFEQRWRKATRWWVFGRGFRRERRWHDDALIHLERISWILSPKPHISEDDHRLWVSAETDAETWHVQIFRSIDSGSLKGFPKIPSEAIAQNLVCEKNVVIDRSIHTAYVQAIRSAQHFIYIENQYFLGSSYAWPSHRDAGADNLVPMELALKIASKIKANERFAVYVVIPLWPEGVPSDAAVQEILFWQNRTMQMMYDIVAREIKSMNSKSHPCEYLNFYCLGKREEPPQEMNCSASQPSQNTNVVAPKKKVSRFMIYVHAKGMIVDDEYVLLGSANINQRSLDGSRDTEIAMGAYQPHYTWNEKRGKPPHGQVYGYRMSLWAEHLGTSDERFKEPHRKDCVMAVNEIADENWNKFTADEFTPLKGHLLRYPVKVETDGKVCPLPNCENFPDFGGKICGADTNLPNALTT